MNEYAIIKIIDENSNCPAAHLLDCIRTFDRRGVFTYCDSLEDANAELFALALRRENERGCEDNPSAIWSARKWSLFCANVARLGTLNTRARTGRDGCRYYHDCDVTAFKVVPVVLDGDGDIDARKTAFQA